MKRFATPLLVLAIGCSTKTVEVGQLEKVLDLPALPNRDVDILFVIDNSPSMLDKQNAMIASFPKMMDALATLPDGLPSLHIGVITSDMGTKGSQDAMPGPAVGSGPGSCSDFGSFGKLQNIDAATGVAVPELNGVFISDIDNGDGTRTRNYTGELRDVFTKIASVGANGCGFEQHFAAMRSALRDNPWNQDFVRPSANLAVVFVADEDDCSIAHSSMLGADTTTLGPLQSFRCTRFGIQCDDGGATSDAMNQVGPKAKCHPRSNSPYVEDVQSSVDFLTSLKGDPRMVMVAGIAAPAAPVAIELRTPPGGGTAIPSLAHSCAYTGLDGFEQVGDPAVRIHSLVDAFPGRASFSSVCDDDLSVSLTSVGYTARKLMGDACIDTALADTSDAPGLQPLCEVAEGTQSTPACDGTNTDYCWQVVNDATMCSNAPDHLRFVVLRAHQPTAQSYVSVRCLRAQ